MEARRLAPFFGIMLGGRVVGGVALFVPTHISRTAVAVKHVTAEAAARNLVGFAFHVIIPPGTITRYRFPGKFDLVLIIVGWAVVVGWPAGGRFVGGLLGGLLVFLLFCLEGNGITLYKTGGS